jgi:CrcB protein
MHLLLIGAGGFVGSILRYLVSSQFAGHVLPGGTFVVNAVGCLIMGVVVQVGEMRGWPSREAQLLVTAGLLGGFTTFSAFGNEAADLLAGHPLWGVFSVVVHVTVAVSAVFVGRVMAAWALGAG